MDSLLLLKKLNLTFVAPIGKGTYGSVFLCKTKDGALTTVKDIPLDVKFQDDDKRDTENEVRILSRLRHPNVVRYLRCCRGARRLLIAMEYAAHGSLAEFMAERFPKQLKEEEVLFFFSQILLGVSYIHGRGVIHRDLKADNVLLGGARGLCVKISDFGISKMLQSAKQTSTVIGTPYYLAPELCRGTPYDCRSDVWALGCLLYEMCAHRRAFEAETLVGLVEAITTGSVPPIDATVYSRGVQDAIDCMLSVLPAKRPDVRAVMAHTVLLPFVYGCLLDAGDDDKLQEFYAKVTGKL